MPKKIVPSFPCYPTKATTVYRDWYTVTIDSMPPACPYLINRWRTMEANGQRPRRALCASVLLRASRLHRLVTSHRSIHVHALRIRYYPHVDFASPIHLSSAIRQLIIFFLPAILRINTRIVRFTVINGIFYFLVTYEICTRRKKSVKNYYYYYYYYRLAGPHDQRPYRGKRHIGKSPLYLPRRFIKDAIL